MKIINNLLERYAHIQAPNATIKNAFINAVEETIDFIIDKKDVKIHNHTAHINAPSVIKSEIRFNQQDILKKVTKQVGDKNALTAIF
ncbi:hypothetical protein CL644_01280 [bacterium]|nr:hypothetical protein [Parcubacteria group bacterium]MBF05320.1 hypothetical protein [bacterium]|tara:strand:- start:103 stop:363 length:261 start_codon:yes stop_codon:yes gene_type:complete